MRYFRDLKTEQIYVIIIAENLATRALCASHTVSSIPLLIIKIRRYVMKIGLIVAIEMESVFEYYKNVTELDSPCGYKVYYTKKEKHEIYIIRMGMGEIAASAGVQYAITKYGVDLIVNFGVVGGLSNKIIKQRVCVIDRVVHYKYDCSEFMPLKKGQVDGHDSIFLTNDLKLVEKALEVYPELKKATCCSGDKFVGTAEEKTQLHNDFEGDVCDMESAGIVLTCEANSVRCLMLKAVSDSLMGGAKEFYEELKDASIICLQVTDKIIDSL